jgi:integrase/recombinase XerD
MSIQPVSQPSSPLRRRMLEDVAIRGLREDTQRGYVQFVRSFAAFLSRPLDTATPEDIRQFQVHHAESGVQPPTINWSVSVLRRFFTVTFDRPDLPSRFVQVRLPDAGCAARRGGRGAKDCLFAECRARILRPGG